MSDIPVHSEEELEGFARKDLQALAKKVGIKANLKSAAIIEQLLDYYKENGLTNESEAPTSTPSTPSPPSPVKQTPEPVTEKVTVSTEFPTVVQKTPEKTPETTQKAPTPPVSPSPLKKTTFVVPPSPLQKFVKSVSVALTPRKTPGRPGAITMTSKTPAKDSLYIITPRKNKNRKNLFGASPEKFATPKRV